MATRTKSTDVSEIPQNLEAEIALMANALGGEKKSRKTKVSKPSKKATTKKVTPKNSAKTPAKKATATVAKKPITKKLDDGAVSITVRKVAKEAPKPATSKQASDAVIIPVKKVRLEPKAHPDPKVIVRPKTSVETVRVTEKKEDEKPQPVVVHQTNVSITSIEQPLYDGEMTPEVAAERAEELAILSNKYTNPELTPNIEGLRGSLHYDPQGHDLNATKRLVRKRSPLWLRALAIFMGLVAAALLVLQTNIIPL